MTAYKITVNSVDYTVSKPRWNKNCQSGVDMATVTLPLTYASTFTNGQEAELYQDSTKLFAGYIDQIKLSDRVVMKIESYGGYLKRKMVNVVYEDKTPEYIIQDLIENYGNLTYASSWSTGITLKRVIISDKYISEVISKMCDVVGGQFRTDENANGYFEEDGTATTSADHLIVGTNCSRKNEWTIDPTKIMNSLIVKGGSQSFSTMETFSGTGSQVDFVLAYKPKGGVRAVVDGSEKIGQLEGSSGKDFSVDSENKTVTFESAPSNSSDNVVIYYQFDLPIKVSVTNPASISTYGLREKKVIAGWITRFEDARTLANKLVSQYSSPTKSNILVLSGINTSYTVGSSRNVTDSDKGITAENMVISKIEYDTERGLTYLTVGSEIYSIFDWNKTAQEQIKDLTDFFTQESTIQEYLLCEAEFSVSFDVDVTVKTRNINDSFIIGHPTASRIGATYTRKIGCQASSWNTLYP